MKIPRFVKIVCFLHKGWIVGSSAKPDNFEASKDIDIIVPFSEWSKVACLIPKTARPNSFGGWKFTEDDREIDVWPGEFHDILWVQKMNYIYNPHYNVRWQMLK